ncbi:Outer membrane protein assembly factor BamD [Granulosicoccus antarcticus IMCC3135]|uniref:Outer membrane protein assembly factor BamD n=1 Tax=Granulosicoccus antarcticus IMCC3135 TaxID=1192854 RepID=A0A2Z2P5E2_9GAMM|nr:Outer membrane protein assembly factor BamD [Granulosicoccus antarcticus IMCC3135]
MDCYAPLKDFAVGCKGNLFASIVGIMLIMPGSGVQAANDDGQAALAYEAALEQIEQQEYSAALASLRQLQRRYPAFTEMASVQTRIAVLQESSDAGQSLPVFLRALSLRDAGDMEAALQALDTIASADPAGTLTDDALYISAYLQVMDRYDFKSARSVLAILEQRFPDSAYSDSAYYLDAIALEQLGETQQAREKLVELRARHTALDLPMNFRWPRGSVLSRYWFDRADRRLAIVDQRLASASQLGSVEEQSDGKLRLAVNVDGVDMQLLLVPSPLTGKTQWLDSSLASQLPPAIGIFDGVVEGMPNSWVRLILEKDSMTGVVNIDGQQHRLQPANLIGTLDYYQPVSKKIDPLNGMHSDLADSVQGLDALVAPAATPVSGLQTRARDVTTDIRAVAVSIVVDSQFDRYYAGGGMAAALNSLNIADGVYRELGLALTLDEALTFAEASDPMNLGTVTLESILRSFRDYRLEYSTLFADSALTYLFTGNPKSDVTLGLAWIDTACRLDGYDVGVTTPSTFGDVLLTHELGHSLGAKHDTDTECDDNSRSLMWPNISSRTEIEFSQCSKTSVLQSRAKSCLENSVNLSLSAASAGSSLVFEMFNPDGSLTLDAQLLVETSAPDQLIWPAGCQAQTPTSSLCYISELLPLERRSLGFEVSDAFQSSDAPVTAQLVPLGLLELQSSDNIATASPTGGSSLTHLSVVAEPLAESQTSDTSTEDSAVSSPSAAKEGGGGTSWWWLASLGCALVYRGLLVPRSGRVPSSGVISRFSRSPLSVALPMLSSSGLRSTVNTTGVPGGSRDMASSN